MSAIKCIRPNGVLYAVARCGLEELMGRAYADDIVWYGGVEIQPDEVPIFELSDDADAVTFHFVRSA